MQSHGLLNRILAILVAMSFVWFFASSLSIAYQKCLQHDDAMFATVPKNFLNGDGWVTRYGEKIPFNPDMSTGPTLWIPATLMIAAFGNQIWVPAITGTVMNITLTLLVLWQLRRIVRNKVAAAAALLLSISLFAVNDFKTFTGYYTTCLLFLFSLLLVLNPQYRRTTRMLLFGALAAIGLYAKPLILLSYVAAMPLVIVCTAHGLREPLWRYLSRSTLIVSLGFALVFLPWYFYKNSILAHESPTYRAAHAHYGQQFFEFHGSGIGQLQATPDKVAYLQRNSAKNHYLMNEYLRDEINFPLYALMLTVLVALLIALQHISQRYRKAAETVTTSAAVEAPFAGILACVIAINLLWFVVVSFSMTAGHAYYLTFFAIFLLFFLMASSARSNALGVGLCLLMALTFQVRHPALIEAYKFKAADTFMSNQDITKVKNFLAQHEMRYPLASCGWNAAPWLLEFLLPQTYHFVDCFNVLEDSLVLDEQDYIARNPGINLQVNGRAISPTEHFFTQGLHRTVHATFHWQGSPDFTIAAETMAVVGMMTFASYVLAPMGEACEKHMLFNERAFVVCEVSFDEYRDKLDPTETARQLVDYQGWYRTRVKVY